MTRPRFTAAELDAIAEAIGAKLAGDCDDLEPKQFAALERAQEKLWQIQAARANGAKGGRPRKAAVPASTLTAQANGRTRPRQA